MPRRRRQNALLDAPADAPIGVLQGAQSAPEYTQGQPMTMVDGALRPFSDEQFEHLIPGDEPYASDADAVVYPRHRRQAQILKEAAANEMPGAVDGIAGPTLNGLADHSADEEPYIYIGGEKQNLKAYLRGVTLSSLYDGSMGDITLGMPIPSTLEDAINDRDCNDLIDATFGPVSSDPEEIAQWVLDERERKKLAKLTAKFQAKQDAWRECAFGETGFQQVNSAQCAEPARFTSYNPFQAYVSAREQEGAYSAAMAEQILNPYGGYLGEDGDMDISYGPYQEIEPYVSPNEMSRAYIQRVYNDATITDAEMKQIADFLRERPGLRQSAYAGTDPGTRDPIIAGAGFGATLCTSYYPCGGNNQCLGAHCSQDPCIYYQDSCDGPVTMHGPGIAYYNPGGYESNRWGDPNYGDLFQARMDRCYYECIHRRRRTNPSLETPLTEAQIEELCAPERCLPGYCLDHHLAAPNMDPSVTTSDPRDAMPGRTDDDICRVAWVLANGWGIDDTDNDWWTAMTGAPLPANGFVGAVAVPNDTCDGRYGNWRGKPCAFARMVTQMAVWSVQWSAQSKVPEGGIFAVICAPGIQNPNNYSPGAGPFAATLDKAFQTLTQGAARYAAESDCMERIGDNASDYFTGPTNYAKYPNGDIDRSVSAATPYPPRSLRDLNLPVISNCNADAQSITACATDTRHMFWTAIPNEVRVVCGRVLVGPFRLHSTVGSVNPPTWEIKNTCGCNDGPENPEYDETSPRCVPGGDWYHTSHCSNLFSFTDYCGNPICCDPGPFREGQKLPDEPCLDTDFYVAVKITGRYMCFTLCVQVEYTQVEVLMFPNVRESIGTRCPNTSITPEVACICVCVETPQEEPGPDLFPPPAVFPPPPPPQYTRPVQQQMPQPFLIAPPPPPRPPKPPEFPPPIVIPPPPPPPPMPPRVVQPVIIPPPAPPLPPDRMPPCEPIVVVPPPACPTLPEIPPPAPVIVAPPQDIRRPVILPPMPPLPQSMRGARPVRLPQAIPPQANCPPWPQRPMPPINGAPPPMPGYESSPIPGMPPPWPVTPPPNGGVRRPEPNPFTPGPMGQFEYCNPGKPDQC